MVFSEYVRRWQLVPDGEAIHTHSSDLLPVRWNGLPGMLKVARSEEEEQGNRLMVWWDGRGAAQVWRHDGPALLMERLQPEPVLAEWARTGRDTEASLILCDVVGVLHQPAQAWPELTRLSDWFRALREVAPSAGEELREALGIAERLLADPVDVLPLHGDIHHGNVLRHPVWGWLAIDPKGLIGERAFDYANIFCNPDFGVATQPGRLAGQVAVVARAAGLERRRLLGWIVAYSALSAAWYLEDNEPQAAQRDLRITRLALAELRVDRGKGAEE